MGASSRRTLICKNEFLAGGLFGRGGLSEDLGIPQRNLEALDAYLLCQQLLCVMINLTVICLGSFRDDQRLQTFIKLPNFSLHLYIKNFSGLGLR